MTGIPLLVLLALTLSVGDAAAVLIYRIGTPFSAVEKDSLESIGIDFREIDWSASQLRDALELDSLQQGSLQPNFFAADEDIAATLQSRDGFVGVMAQNRLYWEDTVLAMVDQDPTTAYTWPAIAPESFDDIIDRQWGVFLDLGGRFLVREVRYRPLQERPDHFLEHFRFSISEGEFSAYRRPEFRVITEVRENTEPEVSVAASTHYCPGYQCAVLPPHAKGDRTRRNRGLWRRFREPGGI